MSTKRNILILVSSLLFGMLTAQNHYEFGFDLMTQKYEHQETNTYYLNHLYTELSLTKALRLNVENRFRQSDVKPGDYLERTQDYVNAGLLYSGEKITSSLSVINRNYHDSAYKDYYPELHEGTYKKNNRNLLQYTLDYEFPGVMLENDIRYKSDDLLRKKRVTGVLNYYDEHKTALYYNGELSYQFIKDMSVSASFYSKNENEDIYDHNRFALGLRYEHIMDYFKWIDIQSEWAWNQSDIIEHKNQLTTQARFKYRMGTNLNAFVSAYNHLVYDNSEHEFLLAANYLRAQLKYSLDYDQNAESYLLAGVKYSEENYASAFFAEIKNHIGYNIYCSYGYQYKQVIINTHTLQLMWYFNPLSYVYYSYQLVNDNDFDTKYNTMNVGMLWAF